MAIGRIPEPGTGIPESIIAAKGDLLTGTANDTPAVLTVGADGTTLVADSSTATGLKYQAPTVNTVIDAKGDLLAGTAADTIDRIAVGANDTVLTADSSTATGLKWATPASGGAYTLLSTNTISGTTNSVSGISGAYTELIIVVTDYNAVNDNSDPIFRFNDDTGSNYVYSGTSFGSVTSSGSVSGVTSIPFGGGSGMDNVATDGFAVLRLFRYAATDAFKAGHAYFCFPQNDGYFTASQYGFAFKSTSAITKFNLNCSGAGFAGGTIRIYGAN